MMPDKRLPGNPACGCPAVSGRFRVMDEVDYFRMAEGPEVL